MSSITGGGATINGDSITGGGSIQDLSVSNLTITNKGLIQREINEFTNAKELVSKEYVDANSGGSGNVVGPASSIDNGVCFYDGTTGKLIKEVSTIKYNPGPNSLDVPDLSTTATTSLNTDLQKISNISSAVQTPTPVTEFNGAISSSGNIKVYDPTGANLTQSILKKDRLEFSGKTADNGLGIIRFEDGATYKQIIMSVDKGNFINQSRGIISVDNGIYQFGPFEFTMYNKRIITLADPTNPQDAANKQYVDQKFVNPVINNSITLENETTPNTLLLASFATGENQVNSSGDLEINGSNLTMNLTSGTLTENVGNNKISIVSGNLTEAIAANKVTNITANHISTASSHTFNGPLTSSTSVQTPILTGVSEITNNGDIEIKPFGLGGNLVINMDSLIMNSIGGLVIQQGGLYMGLNELLSFKTVFTNDQEMVTKKYVDDAILPLRKTVVLFNQSQDYLVTNNGFYTDGNITLGWDAQNQTEFLINTLPATGGITVSTLVGITASSIFATQANTRYDIGGGIGPSGVLRSWVHSNTDAAYPNYDISIMRVGGSENSILTVEKW